MKCFESKLILINNLPQTPTYLMISTIFFVCHTPDIIWLDFNLTKPDIYVDIEIDWEKIVVPKYLTSLE